MVIEKKTGSYAHQRSIKGRAYADSLSIRERFPQIEQLVLAITFVDPQGLGIYSPQMRTLSAGAKAFFAIACPRTLCLDGGFDLDPIIVAMLKAHRGRSTDMIACPGWVDPARTAHSRCGLELRYEIEMRYVAVA